MVLLAGKWMRRERVPGLEVEREEEELSISGLAMSLMNLACMMSAAMLLLMFSMLISSSRLELVLRILDASKSFFLNSFMMSRLISWFF